MRGVGAGCGVWVRGVGAGCGMWGVCEASSLCPQRLAGCRPPYPHPLPYSSPPRSLWMATPPPTTASSAWPAAWPAARVRRAWRGMGSAQHGRPGRAMPPAGRGVAAWLGAATPSHPCTGPLPAVISDPASPEAQKLEAAVTALLQGLAKSIAWDGEGATVLIECEVLGAADQAAANKVRRRGLLSCWAGDGGEDGWARGRLLAAGVCSAGWPHRPAAARPAWPPRWPSLWWGPAWPRAPSLAVTPTGGASPRPQGERVMRGRGRGEAGVRLAAVDLLQQPAVGLTCAC